MNKAELRGSTSTKDRLRTPRPVDVDESGQLFESSGEPILIPGLEPEVILDGLAELEAGRLTSLNQKLAGRKEE